MTPRFALRNNSARTTLAAALAATFVLGFASSAQAATLQHLGFANGSVATTITAPTNVSTAAGEFLFRYVETNEILRAFCIEISQFIVSPDGNYIAASLALDGGLSAQQKLNLDKLYTNYYGSIGGNTDRSAGFQLAVWEIVNEPNPSNVTTGTFRVTSGANAINFANTWVQSLASLTATGGYELTTWRSRSSQDQISARRVPEPASLALAALGVAAIGAIRRRRTHV